MKFILTTLATTLGLSLPAMAETIHYNCEFRQLGGQTFKGSLEVEWAEDSGLDLKGEGFLTVNTSPEKTLDLVTLDLPFHSKNGNLRGTKINGMVQEPFFKSRLFGQTWGLPGDSFTSFLCDQIE